LAASGFADRRLRGSDPAGWLGTRRVRRPERDRRSVALAVAGGALLALAGSGCAFGSPSQVGGVRGASTSATPGGPGGAAAVTPAGSAPSGAASTAGASASLQGVACVAAADCWAVGWSTADTAGQPETLIAQDTGAGWRVLASPPVPGSAGAELDAVTCAGDGDCWAVGYSWQGSGAARTTQPLVERETPAGGWTTVSSPAPTGVPDSALDGVACAANGDCWAVGYSSTSTAAGVRSETLIEQDPGNGWSIVASPAPAGGGAGGQLAGVACTGSACWAVGHWDTTAGIAQALVEENAGSAWTVVPGPGTSPTPGRGASPAASLLTGVTCVGQSTCWSAGSVLGSKGGWQGLLEEDTGSGWSTVPTPASGSQLLGVACAGIGNCWAVGASTVAGSGTLIEQETAAGWTVVPTTLSTVTTDPQLNGVACVGAGECWAVGGPAPSGSGSMILEQIAGAAA